MGFGVVVIATVLIALTSLPCAMAIYCEEDDCYDLLGLTQSATASDIKKAYYKLSLKFHPDKNPDPAAKKIFMKVANAYEILRDDATREQYDYAIAHPEQVFYNTARYYQAYYGPKADIRVVLAGLVVIISGFQYLNQWTRHNQMVTMVKNHPAYRNKLKALELERSGVIYHKKKGSKLKYKENVNARSEDLDRELELQLSKELQIQGIEKPSIWKLVGVLLLLSPYTVGKLTIWKVKWIWRYSYKKEPYSLEDSAYLTRSYAGITDAAWASLDEAQQNELVQRKLWISSNLAEYTSERRKEARRRRS